VEKRRIVVVERKDLEKGFERFLNSQKKIECCTNVSWIKIEV
jgi:hypothetical protein